MVNDVDCDSLGEVTVRGLDEPILVWRVNALRGGSKSAERTAFVGRQSELKQFGAVIEACLAR